MLLRCSYNIRLGEVSGEADRGTYFNFLCKMNTKPMLIFVGKMLPFPLMKKGLGNALNLDQFNQLYDTRRLKKINML